MLCHRITKPYKGHSRYPAAKISSTLSTWTRLSFQQQNSGVVEYFIYRIPQFIYESKSERIIEIGPRLPKLS